MERQLRGLRQIDRGEVVVPAPAPPSVPLPAPVPSSTADMEVIRDLLTRLIAENQTTRERITKLEEGKKGKPKSSPPPSDPPPTDPPPSEPTSELIQDS
jgi:hypothetical protein